MKIFAVCTLCTFPADNAPDASPIPAIERSGPIDQWQSFISEAGRQFGIPDAWIRRVMAVESGGHATLRGKPITSDAGAMGLMQVMPQTYRALRAQYGLGADAYDPHDNILAGAAYLRQMYERYGYPSLFAAYNAGPKRLDDFPLRGQSLPQETVAYVQNIVPGTQIGLGASTNGSGLSPAKPASLAIANAPVTHPNSLFFVRNDANSVANTDGESATATPQKAESAPVISEPNSAQLFVPLSNSSR